LSNNHNVQGYLRSKVDSGKRPNGRIHLFEAFLFLKSIRFGKSASGETEQRVIQLLRQSFFSNAPLHESQFKGDRIEVRLTSCGDGDTCKISHFRDGSDVIPFSIALRLSGIDTPESNPSGKLDNIVKYTSLYLNRTYRMRDDLRPIVRERVQYTGKIAGLIAEAFRQNSKRISIAPTFVRSTEDPAMCGSLDLLGKYGRLIGRLMSGGPNQKEDLLVGFIKDVLPDIMAKQGKELHEEFKSRGKQYEGRIDKWKHSKPELWKTLSPETLPDPSKIYSKENCEILAKKWVIFCKLYPEAKNDFQTMITFIGAGFPYPKYRMNLTDIDLKAEAVAMGAIKFPGQHLLMSHGMNSDIIYQYMRPNADPKDPFASPVFRMFLHQMSGGRDLNPPDCKDK